MKIRFSPPWEVDSGNINTGATVKKLELLQGQFFNWLYECTQGFSSKELPTVAPVELYKQIMAPPLQATIYYDLVLNLVEAGSNLTLADLYELECDSPLVWKIRCVDNMVIAKLQTVKAGTPNSFDVGDDKRAKEMFCAELFKFMRGKVQVADESFSTSTIYAKHPVLAQIYACHLLQG